MTNVEEGYDTITLGKLLTHSQARRVQKLIESRNKPELRSYLDHIRVELAAKGVDSAYLYYALEHQFKL